VTPEEREQLQAITQALARLCAARRNWSVGSHAWKDR
jgi:hypothetical protein